MIDGVILTRKWSKFCLTCRLTSHSPLSPAVPYCTGAVVSSQRSKDWRSRLQCVSVRTVTTTFSMSSAPRAETELCLHLPRTERSRRPRLTCPASSKHPATLSKNHMYSVSFITTGVKKEEWSERKLFHHKKEGKKSIDWARFSQSPATARL